MKVFDYKDWFLSVGKLGKVSKRAFKDAWPGNQGVFIRMALLTIIASTVPFLSYWCYSKTIGALADPLLRPMAIWYVIGALLITLFGEIFDVVERFTQRQIYHRLQTRFSLLFYGKKAGLGIDQLENPKFRDLVTKAQERDIWPIMNILEGQFDNFGGLIRLLSALSIVAAYDWKLCLLVCIALVPKFLVDVRHGRTLWSIFDSETGIRRRYSEFRRHFLGRHSLTELKLFQNVEYFLKQVRAMLQGFQESQEKAEKRRHWLSAGASIVSATLIGVVMVAVLLKVTKGSLPIDSFVFLWSSVGSLYYTLGGILRQIAQQNEWALYALDMYQVIDAEPEFVRLTGTAVGPKQIPEIVFDRVSFVYPWDQPDREILHDVSFAIRPGERIALVGVNGAGKTTLIKLLCGIYRPTSGRILINGVNLKDVDIKWWRKQLAVLFQNYIGYQVSIREAIAMGCAEEPLDETRVREAAQSGGADQFIAELPNGYNTIIGKDFEGGIDLSGGQNQRLALARVFYRQGTVVILDEPTASLDAFAEAEIFEKLESGPRDSTMILITHRFSTIRGADHIVVLEHGKLVEEGSHEELMEQNGLYAEMFQKQAQGYIDEPEVEPVME